MFYCKTRFCNKTEFTVDPIYYPMHLMHLAYAVNFDSTNHIDLNCSDRVYVHHLTPMAENRPVGVSLHNLRSKFTKLGHRSI